MFNLKRKNNINAAPKSSFSQKGKMFGSSSVKIVFLTLAIFFTLIVSTIVFNIILKPFSDNKNNQEITKTNTVQLTDTSGSNSVYQSDFVLDGFKVSSQVPASWKGIMVDYPDKGDGAKKITYFNDSNDRIVIILSPIRTNERKGGPNTGGAEVHKTQDLLKVGSLNNVNIYRKKDASNIIDSQYNQEDYSFTLYGENNSNEATPVFTVKDYSVQITYYCNVTNFVAYRANDILKSLDTTFNTIKFL